MLSCHLRAISRLRTPVLGLGVSRLAPSIVRQGTERFLSISSVRHSDSGKTGSSELDLLLGVGDETSGASELLTKDASEFIVDVPAAAQTVAPPSEIFNESATSSFSTDFVDFTNLVEPSFASMGLGHAWPSGWMQTVLEFVHIDIGLPWWQTIGLTTIALRCVVLPVMVIAQKNMVNMNEHQPAMQKLQVQAQLASVKGNIDEAAFANKCLYNYMMTNNCHPVKTLFPIMCQASFFTSMFFGLRGMVNVPVQSLSSGGILWFTDLSIADPTCVLPVLTASTLFLQLYLGADGINLDTMPPIVKKLMFAMPLISIPVMINFSSALNVYWLTNNMISLVQSRVMKRPAVRTYLGIPEMTKWKPEDLPATYFHEELKREIALQRSKQDKEDARKTREKREFQEKEHQNRKRLLESFEEEARKEAEKQRIAQKND
eukprot:GFUD01007085.1.p1 GENE.GFUD01007085.1~~GFUD01007085.1.p1  ORF type:complete len:432 (+),score=101.77 GFUD01007085.1:42-1337(+)